MKIKPVHARAKCPVALRFQRSGIGHPIFTGITGKGFGGHHAAAASVANRGGFNDAVSRVKTKMPELALRHISDPAERKIAGGIHIVGFHGKSQPVFMSQLFQIADVVLHGERAELG